MNEIKLIAFDADDTLWDCQGHFERVMQQLYTELEPWGDRQTAARELFATERKNMPMLGFGTKAFTLSVMETAMRVSHNEIRADRLWHIQQLCYGLLEFPCTPLAEVEETLRALRETLTGSTATTGTGTTPAPGCRMVVFTKGELQDQENKLRRSGLLRYFDDVTITSDKTQHEFRYLCEHNAIHPSQLLMVGNSLKSDIAPALAIGARAVYIPFHVTWELEHTENFEHPRMVQIARFSELMQVLGLKKI